MSSSEDSEVSYTDYEYVREAENGDDRNVSPPTSDDQATAFADDPLADAEWTVQYEKEMEKEKELEQELTERLQGSKPVSESGKHLFLIFWGIPVSRSAVKL